MSKKFLSLISVLFLVSILAVSCSNADKTGDGGTTTQGIAKYAGTWNYQETNGIGKGAIVIGEDGSVTHKEMGINSKDVTDKRNETYEVKFVGEDPDGEILTLTLTFNNDNKTGSYEAPDPNGTPHNGTLTKQQ